MNPTRSFGCSLSPSQSFGFNVLCVWYSFIIYNKYHHFQKSCTKISMNANANDTRVFMLIASSRNTQVMIANMVIPLTNETNRPGQNTPLNPSTANRVASINIQVIGTPISISTHRYVLAHGHMSGPLVCIHTTLWP